MKVPVTATHRNKETGEFLRYGRAEYAQCYLDGFWVDCGLLKNYKMPPDGYVPVSYKYQKIYKRGISRFICNLRLALIKSKYRV